MRRSSGLVMLAVTLAGSGARAQSTKPPTQPLRLPDPTPRELDPHLKYGDPADAGRQQMIRAALREQQHQQVVAEVNEIVLLAQGLRERVEHPEVVTTSPPEVMAAQKIEKLAKTVKEQLKLQ